jgi:hypothetical protein
MELTSSLAQISNESGPGMRVDDGGVISLHVASDSRATAETVGSPYVYSAIDVDDAILNGEIRADFDYKPAPGRHTYDLIVGGSAGSLASTMGAADFRVNHLPQGFQVDFFGVTSADLGHGTVDVVRLAISPAPLQAGDANQDYSFEQLDLVKVQVAAKYLTGAPASWGEGDWNGAPGGSPGYPPFGDGVFDQRDIIAALQSNTYRKGWYAAIGMDVAANDRSAPIWFADAASVGSVAPVNVPVPEPATVLLLGAELCILGPLLRPRNTA